ncbi:MAG: TetR/AcrR family transcriptional regulator [Erysipelotrichaceae bacterium]|nr:TetR/AcrR family transcriptional regulator [Erysipelotrichaceae bacterium]
MKKQPEITKATKDRITEAFFELYTHQTINKIRIIDITNKAHCHRSTFYEYFVDIYAVLDYLEKRIIDDIIHNIDLTYNISLEAIAKIYQRNGKYICVLLGETGDPKFLSYFKEALYKPFLDKQNIPDNGINELIYEYSLTGLIIAFRYWYLHQDICSLDKFLEIMQKMIQQGSISLLQ